MWRMRIPFFRSTICHQQRHAWVLWSRQVERVDEENEGRRSTNVLRKKTDQPESSGVSHATRDRGSSQATILTPDPMKPEKTSPHFVLQLAWGRYSLAHGPGAVSR